MLNSLTNRYHLRLEKGKNIIIVIHLLINYLYRIRLFIYKRLRKIKKPIIHYYALCWNEEKILPFVFDYYDRFVDKYFIYDNYSCDKSKMIIDGNPKATVYKFRTEGFNDVVHQDIKNNCWKSSRGKADYVIVCDIDEFLYHPRLSEFLQNAINAHISLFHPNGYDMYSESYPNFVKGSLITDQIKTGIESSKYSKSIIFDPNRIVEINYLPGAHKCFPIGIVNQFQDDELKLLHYKNIDLEIYINRTKTLANRLSMTNINNKYGIEYLREISELREEFINNLRDSHKII